MTTRVVVYPADHSVGILTSENGLNDQTTTWLKPGDKPFEFSVYGTRTIMICEENPPSEDSGPVVCDY